MAAYYEAQTGVIQLDRSWDGLEPPSRESEVDTEVLVAFAADLEAEVDRLTAPESVLSRLAAEPAYPREWWFGHWQTAQNLRLRAADAQFFLLRVYEEMVAELRNAIWLIRAEVVEVLGEEEAARRGINVLDPQLASARLPLPPAGSGDQNASMLGESGAGGGGA